jgi:predicted transcriptional regulator
MVFSGRIDNPNHPLGAGMEMDVLNLAERRVDEVAARAKQDISRARSSAVILAFMAGAAALLGAIAAWAAAVTAGRYRDGQEAIPALWDWGSESRSLFSKNTR